jgi:hypothetical protein
MWACGKKEKNGKFSVKIMYFFERTAQDSECFIDIEETNTRL